MCQIRKLNYAKFLRNSQNHTQVSGHFHFNDTKTFFSQPLNVKLIYITMISKTATTASGERRVIKNSIYYQKWRKESNNKFYVLLEVEKGK